MFANINMKTIKLLTIFIIGLSLSSCLEILEDIKINNDGSGTFKLIVNLSKSKGQIDKLMAQDSIRGSAVPTQGTITSAINTALGELGEQNGITAITKKLDFDNYIFNVSFDFKDIDNLNQAVNNIIKARDPNAPLDPIHYDFEEKQFSRTLNTELLNQANRDKEKVSAFLTDFDLAKITSITRFESEINNTDHSTAKISSNGKNCFEQLKINQILTNKSFHKHNIILK